MQFFWWLGRLLSLVVRSKIVPTNAKDEIGLRSDVPVCYVLSAKSLSDLLVLEEACRRQNLPLPHALPSVRQGVATGSYICLQKVGFLQVTRQNHAVPSPLLSLIHEVGADPAAEMQIVPVSVFWGRNPGREEKSIMKLLFFDDEHAGWFQKIFIILIQGRANYVQFGKPISLRKLNDEGLGPEQTAKKLRRVLRVHFRLQRTATLGPSLPSRESVVFSLMQSKAVKKAVADEARKKKISMERAEHRARKYIAEIASEQKYSVIRLADIMFSWLWHRLFNGVTVQHSHRLREIDPTHEIVYLPAHRSHLDYLLLAYTLYAEGMTPPHTAAGVNLNFWPVGPFLRRGGAFYLRRSFGGDRLYATVFNEYVHFLLTKGHPVKFYVEGGRSRTGRLLQPKTGMLSMIVQSYLRNSDKPIVFVPTYVGYDKVAEVGSYQNELRGAKKKTESIGQLVKARRVLKTNFGKAYLGFGEPLYLKDFLDAQRADWRDEVITGEEKPPWLNLLVQDLARVVLTRVNSTAVVSPVGLAALVLLSVPTHALPEDELLFVLDKFLELMRRSPYSVDVVLPPGGAREILAEAMKVAKIQRFQHPGGDVIHTDEAESVSISYYRNNMIHLVMIPAMVAAFFQHNERVAENTLKRAVLQFYPLVQKEFFLRFDVSEVSRLLDQNLEVMVSLGLLTKEGLSDDAVIHRPSVTSRELTALYILARSVRAYLERYAFSSILLIKKGADSPVEKAEFEAEAHLLAQRSALLSGTNDSGGYNQDYFQIYWDALEELGYVQSVTAAAITMNSTAKPLADSSMMLLSNDIRQSIRRMASERADA